MPTKRGLDRRIARTRNLLHEALACLIREKNYNAITVQEILDRANVGRSTFYTHFRDKDELLVSGIRDLLDLVRSQGVPSAAKRPDPIIWFSLPVFAHIDQHRHKGDARMGAEGRAVIHEHLQRVLVDLIAGDVRRGFSARRKVANPLPPDLLVRHVASTFILVLNWWLESRSALSPEQVNDLFRRLILPTLSEA